jgi:plasmid stabilization system protein ParE
MGPTYKVVLSKGAQRDLRRIYDYLLEHVSYETAERVREGLESELTKLSKAPESRGLLRGHNSKIAYRRVMKWSYRIIFSIAEQELIVEVVRVDHSSADPARLSELP